MLKLKIYLIIAVLCISASLTACIQPAPRETPEGDGTIIIYVTDASPDEEVTSIMVTLSEVQVHKASAEQESSSANNQTQAIEQEQTSRDEEGRWVTIDISSNTTFDLLQIKGNEQFIGTSKVEATKYTQIRLVIDTIQVKLGSGNLTNATLPSNELKIVQPFSVIEGETTALVLDFEADKMVTFTGVAEKAALPMAETATVPMSESMAVPRVNNIVVQPVVKLEVRQEKP